MRALAVALLVAACATTPAPPPPERVAGCWIARARDETTTMRWLPDAARPGVLRGDLLRYPNASAQSSQRYALEQRAAGWTLCQTLEEGERCWLVAEGEEGSLEGGRAFIDAHRERLSILLIDHTGVERTVFNGRRDGCD